MIFYFLVFPQMCSGCSAGVLFAACCPTPKGQKESIGKAMLSYYYYFSKRGFEKAV